MTAIRTLADSKYYTPWRAAAKPLWLLALILLVLIAACGGEGPKTTYPAAETTTPTASPSATLVLTPRPPASPTLQPAATAPAPSPATGRILAQVVRVIDGDTVDVVFDGQQHRVRYIGIDTPETVDPRLPVECFGREATQRNRELVEDKTVELEKDISETDRFDRLLRYVWVDGQMVNALLVEEGYAVVVSYAPDVKHQELLLELQSEAREAERGLWTACFTPSPTVDGEGPCDYSGTSQPLIKGNISQTTGEKIYHVPGGQFYAKTVIDEAAGERWFCTEQEAIEAGWRRSKR